MSENFKWAAFGGYEVQDHHLGVDFDVAYTDTYYGQSSVTLDAVEVYRNLKEYFKGTEYE